MKEIPIDNEIERFQTHLQDNKRSILSASFGDGKTYFLNKFKKEHTNEYEFLTLFPVNYSVAKNEDIFEYIKRDILVILSQLNVLDKVDYEAAFESLFNWDNCKEVLSFIMQFIPHGDAFTKIVGKAEALKKKYDDKKSTYEKYNEIFTLQKGGLYEHDGYTQLIQCAINELNKTKKTVLIIEDLDRIDPEHLFRILNVLGAHIDHDSDENKFGFSNIIIVLDYDMTEHIFHHFYGEKANYEGYMSKFVSHYPFRYSIKNVAKQYLYQFIEKECYIPTRSLSNLKFRSRTGLIDFFQVLANKSVRDITKIIDNINEQFITDHFSIGDSYRTKTSPSILKFLSILRRMDLQMSHQDLYYFLTNHVDILYALKTLSNFLLVNEELANYDGGSLILSSEQKDVHLMFDKKNGIITCEVTPIDTTYYRNQQHESEINGFIYKALELALQYVKD